VKLSFVSNAYIKYSIEETIEHVAKYGYQGIEIARTHGVHELSKAKRKNLLAMIKSHGLEVCAIQGGTPDLDLEFAKERVDLAADLGCPVVHLGAVANVLDEKDRERDWKKLVSGFREVANYAKDKGITIAMESVPPGAPGPGRVGRIYPRLVQTLGDIQRMLADVDAENFGFLLDIGHLFVIRENLSYAVEKLGKKIVHVHLEDIVDRIHCHFIPGTGDINFVGTIRALDRINYRGWLSLEIEMHVDEPDRAALESMEYMDDLLSGMGLK
jgi:sugar phosphate isomerase/epimerase